MALGTYVPPTNRIVHETEVDFVTRDNYGRVVYLVQTIDNRMPIIAVHLYKNGVPYSVPANANGNVRWKKPDPDSHYVYNPLLGVNDRRDIAYIEVTRQMVVTPGRPKAIIELDIGGNVSGSERIPIIIDRNPISQVDLESTDEMKSLYDYVSQAADSADAAKDSENAARASQMAAANSASAASASQTAAKTSETNATAAAAAAKASETAAKASENAASASQTAAKTSETNAANSASAASASQTAAKTSETNAANSASAASASQTAAKTSETNAANSASAASASQTAAKTSETNATAAAAAAKASETAAKASENAAGASQTAAATSAKTAEDMSKMSKSYAVGDAGVRDNEDVDNSKYYCDQAKRISEGLAGALLPMGTVAFAQLGTQTKKAGYMYNVSDGFTTDATFREGAGHAYPAGTNVYYTADGYWDCLAGFQVVSVNGQTGAVTVTPASIGAYPLTGGTVNGNVIAKPNDTVACVDAINSNGVKVRMLVNENGTVLLQRMTDNDTKWATILSTPSTATDTNNSSWFAGTAYAASKLATPRNINNVAFDGTRDITVYDSTKMPLHSQQGGVDFNTLTAYGFYQCLGANKNTPDGTPSDSHFHILVLYHTADWVRQIAFDVRTNRIHTRALTNGSWSAWTLVYTAANPQPTATDSTKLPLTGGTLSGKLYANAGVRATTVESTDPHGFRSVYGSYGTFIRNDGTNVYCMITNKNDQYGGWRDSGWPYYYDLATGRITFPSGVTASSMEVNSSVWVKGDLAVDGNLIGITPGKIGAQPALGFTPVQQGGGSGQSANKIYLGWKNGILNAQVDATNIGNIVTCPWSLQYGVHTFQFNSSNANTVLSYDVYLNSEGRDKTTLSSTNVRIFLTYESSNPMDTYPPTVGWIPNVSPSVGFRIYACRKSPYAMNVHWLAIGVA